MGLDNNSSLEYPTMEVHKIVIISLLLMVTLRCVETQYTTVPRNTAGLSGQSLTLYCAKDASVVDPIAWREYISNPSGSMVSLDANVLETYRDRYSVLTPAVGMYNLQVNALSQDEAGRHQCGVNVANERFATVIQLSQPVCTVTPVAAEHDNVTGFCETTFTGLSAWAPQMNWTFNGKTLPVINKTSGQLAKYTTSFSVSLDMHGGQFACLTYFHEPPDGQIPPDTALTSYDRRAPVFFHQCQTSSIVVQFGPRDLRIQSNSDLIPGQSISCTAMGRPEPSYRWLKVEGAGTQTIINGPVLIMTSDMNGYNTYRCVATNILVGGREKNISGNVSFCVHDLNQTTYSCGESVTTELQTISSKPPCSNQQATTSGGIGAGGIAAIVLGVLMIMQTAAFISYCFHTRKAGNGKATTSFRAADPYCEINGSQIRRSEPIYNELNISQIERSVPGPYEQIKPGSREKATSQTGEYITVIPAD